MCLGIACIVLAASPVRAQHADAQRADVLPISAATALDGSSFLTLQRAAAEEAWRWRFGVAVRRLAASLWDREVGGAEREIIGARSQARAALSVGLPRQYAVGLALDYLVSQVAIRPGFQSGSVAASGLGDLSLWGKKTFLARPAGALLALQANLILPSGDAEAYAGVGAPAGGVDLVAQWGLADLRYALQIGYHIAPARSLFSSFEDDYARLVAAWRYGPIIRPWALVAEAELRIGGAPALAAAGRAGIIWRFGSVRLPIDAEMPLSSRPLQPRWSVGAALITTYKRPPDFDGDGLRGSADRCPKIPEDQDGFEDDDGCPDPDNDKDGILDKDDRCPDAAEDLDGFEDADGCPDDDNDGDGVPDRVDGCPDTPEDIDGDLDEDGCPDLDADRDGILDADDRCPEDAEDEDGFEDEDGCPEEDNDGDGIWDVLDDCPLVPENINQIQDEDGCPEPDADGDGILDPDDQCPEIPEDLDKFEDSDGCPDPDNDKDGFLDADDDCPNAAETVNGIDDDDGCPEKAVLEERYLKPYRIQARVHFKRGHWAIQPRSSETISQVAKLLEEHPEITKLQIEGHTDKSGKYWANRRLSQHRADEVLKALVALGVQPDRLEAKGYGWTRPRDRRRGRRARLRNRRVAFVVLEVAPPK